MPVEFLTTCMNAGLLVESWTACSCLHVAASVEASPIAGRGVLVSLRLFDASWRPSLVLRASYDMCRDEGLSCSTLSVSDSDSGDDNAGN